MRFASALVMCVLAVGCAVSEEETVPAPIEAPIEGPVEAPANAPAKSPAEQNFCAPGPSGNWCQNREGHSCPVEGYRSRCFAPNYCEWFMMQCQGGIWVILG